QIELRILAELSGDPTFLAAFRDGADIHAITAAQVFHVNLADITPEQRGFAKAVNFGIIYGISAYSLAEDLGISVKAAGEYIEGYFAKYTQIKQYLDESIEAARRDGFATTIFGRRRRLNEISSANFNTRSFGERAAMNMPVQGSAADIIKIAMVKVHSRLLREGLQARLLLQVHDELLLEAPPDEADKIKQILQEEMAGAVNLNVPLAIDIAIGKNWYESK
ncbi:MAG: DNA polymerase, partial [Defluviitaleaceae bacterium]|nr:DNA polymerase [Defluviitaleaceae bacterium]